MTLRRLLPALALAAFGTALPAVEVATSDYRFVSELAAEGFIAFGTGSAGNALFGMTKGTEIYLCFLLDTPGDQSKRQTALLAELDGDTEDRAIPNIPVVCVLTQ